MNFGRASRRSSRRWKTQPFPEHQRHALAGFDVKNTEQDRADQRQQAKREENCAGFKPKSEFNK